MVRAAARTRRKGKSYHPKFHEQMDIFCFVFFDEPIIFEENGGVLQLRRLSSGLPSLSHHPMTPFHNRI